MSDMELAILDYFLIVEKREPTQEEMDTHVAKRLALHSVTPSIPKVSRKSASRRLADQI